MYSYPARRLSYHYFGHFLLEAIGLFLLLIYYCFTVYFYLFVLYAFSRCNVKMKSSYTPLTISVPYVGFTLLSKSTCPHWEPKKKSVSDHSVLFKVGVIGTSMNECIDN